RRRIGASRGTVSLLRHDRAARAGEQSGARPYPTFHRRRRLTAASEQARGRSSGTRCERRTDVDRARDCAMRPSFSAFGLKTSSSPLDLSLTKDALYRCPLADILRWGERPLLPRNGHPFLRRAAGISFSKSAKNLRSSSSSALDQSTSCT